mmetsp:Transcript_16749/g.41221  ORF Transcript_16749/g.41221 Transcript_16749/m.41221 type:complete len:253 (-) Transcript_16749:2124-2882(-)
MPPAPPRSGTSTSPGGEYLREDQLEAWDGGRPPTSRARSRRKGCTRRSNMPMAPSCVNTAAIRAPMPRSSTFGAAAASAGDDESKRSVDISVPRFSDCSRGTKRSRALPQRCGSSPGRTRSPTEPVSSSKSRGKPCDPSSAKLPLSIHSPIFCNPPTPVISRSSYSGKEWVRPAKRPSGPSPITPSSRHERSSTASNALCAAASGYTRGQAADEMPSFRVDVSPGCVSPYPYGFGLGCPTASSSGTRPLRYR